MDPIKIIKKYYDPKSQAYYYLVEHGKLIQKKALEVVERVKHLNPDIEFIKEASLLHDIGIFLTKAPEIGCHGKEPYIKHGILGRELLNKEGLPRHALVCERHLGVGITKKDIIRENLPLPKRDMIPITLEEKIICFADKFFGKNKETLYKERTPREAMEIIKQYSPERVKKFQEWLRFFGYIKLIS